MFVKMPLKNVKPKIKDLKTTGINVKKEKFPYKFISNSQKRPGSGYPSN